VQLETTYFIVVVYICMYEWGLSCCGASMIYRPKIKLIRRNFVDCAVFLHKERLDGHVCAESKVSFVCVGCPVCK